MEWVLGTAAIIGLLVGLVAFLKGRRPGPRNMNVVSGEVASTVATERGKLPPPDSDLPSRIVVESDQGEVMAMTMLSEENFGTSSSALKKFDANRFGRVLEPLMQIAPSMATAGMANGKQLMEVVINGSLMSAADGNGLRAMARGASGIKEHARLFEPKNLQNVANAAAIWQIASVAVAQKHLADISASLKRIEQHVAGVQSILEEQRAVLIQSALNYVGSAKLAVERGEFLPRTRDKLEDFEIQLEQAGLALIRQIRRESEKALESDTFGCEGEYESALSKHRALAERAQELAACAEVRLANWYLCSIYPDQSKMLDGRMSLIKEFSKDVGAVMKLLSETVEQDCQRIDASFTADSTIAQRRGDVRREARLGADALMVGKGECATMLSGVSAAGVDRSSPMKLLIEVERGQPLAIYMNHEGQGVFAEPVGKRARKKNSERMPAPMI